MQLNVLANCRETDPNMKKVLQHRVALLKEEIDLRETVARESLKRTEAAIEMSIKTSARFQNEAAKCRICVETCEEGRERAEAELVKERRLTRLWEKRARKQGIYIIKGYSYDGLHGEGTVPQRDVRGTGDSSCGIGSLGLDGPVKQRPVILPLLGAGGFRCSVKPALRNPLHSRGRGSTGLRPAHVTQLSAWNGRARFQAQQARPNESKPMFHHPKAPT
ncbi:hypothetical protein CRG98_001415 [Punica granatum]|uniref:Uncharacterized protein n=1 Tax=Punica granatum TaxID=22663 RepID=A0A2I0LC40_PUNGR|nr:hypothetical protein CRG98_001415 [Punica granatum]